MRSGYMGRILRVDLSTMTLSPQELDSGDCRRFVGGSGLGALYLHRTTPPAVDPLGPENTLIFMAGPLAGTKTFSSDRFEVVCKSPLTGIYAESSCGGRFASALKSSGFDGVVIAGSAKRPAYIWIQDGNAEIRDASELWGLDTFDTHARLAGLTHPDAEAAVIGPAGEKLVRYASIHTSGVHSRMAGRAGVGAVMGSKSLKALVAYGSAKVPLHDPAGLMAFWKEYGKKNATTWDAKDLRDNGTIGTLRYCDVMGDLPIRNWSMRRFAGAEKISADALKEIAGPRYYCGSCLVGCGRSVTVPEGAYKTDGIIGGPEYETAAMLGSNLLLEDIRAVSKANEVCNRYGMDTISAGSCVAMAMECREHGLLSVRDLDGIALDWGNADAVIEILHRIGKREGVGRMLGEGTRRMANEIGSYAIEFAVQVKGMEAPAHDPRAKNSLALGYSTSNRGGCHLQAFVYDFEHQARLPDMGITEPLDRFAVDGKAVSVVRMENLMSMCDSLCTCKFMLFCAITLEPLVRELDYVTGFGLDSAEFLKTGERIFNLKRLYNNACGITRKDDTLPPRLLTLKRGTGEEEDQLPPLGRMLDEYYRIRGWDEIGRPSTSKLEELGLTDFMAQPTGKPGTKGGVPMA